MRNRSFTDFGICVGWSIGESPWLFNVSCHPPLSEISRQRKRGLYISPMSGRITILGFFIELQLKSFIKS